MTKILTGKIISVNKIPNTVTVRIESNYKHPLYKKVIKKHKKILAHIDKPINEGEIVRLIEVSPISKRKHFKVLLKEDVKS
ncbi:MAG: 30S ribosomal protein S17 [Candidatus Gottesmanbacteria bacterium]